MNRTWHKLACLTILLTTHGIAHARQALSYADVARVVERPAWLACGVDLMSSSEKEQGGIAVGEQSDCSATLTNPLPQYDPSGPTYRIHIVVHVIQNSRGDGVITAQQIQNQIATLNEDFSALPGSHGAPGTNTRIKFALAEFDPDGKPTTGVTNSIDDTWFADGGNYWETLAWDTTKFLNIYVNNCGATGPFVGYAYYPTSPVAGTPTDRVVIYWRLFGPPTDWGPPYHQGRTLTHEVGHYLGLIHTFQGGCTSATAPGCHSQGDLICDTNPHIAPPFGCGPENGCSFLPMPVNNYMNYNEDNCETNFTLEQARRMRCSLINWRPLAYEIVAAPCPGDIFPNQVVNVDDLLSVINNWGSCPPPPAACQADVSPSGTVDVDDLLAVINSWGSCP